ncbi:hypothetical protein [Robiginitomaculum antarcticum]|uniref:hypothetical protein n=1 Tax=Robiginitomaculum antarcticum TaxID=437507 RepID=UPI00036021E8|nr:hypothetical protein [Robiginitomaculum antarcticum]
MAHPRLIDLLLVPGGTIGPRNMQRGGVFLIGLGTFLQAAQYVSGVPAGLAGLFALFGVTLVVPWVLLWTKRFRDGGYPSVMALIPIVLFPILSMILIMIGLGDIFGDAMSQGMQYPDDRAAMQAAMEEVLMSQQRRVEVTTVIAPIFASLALLFGTNTLIKSKQI